MQLNDDLYKVIFRGNAAIPKEKVGEMLLRRSAELTRQNGYKYFIVAASNVSMDSHTISTPTTVNTMSTGNINGYGYGAAYRYGNNVNYNMNYNGNYQGNTYTTINPGQAYHLNRYTAESIIKMINKKIDGAINAEIYLRNFENRQY